MVGQQLNLIGNYKNSTQMLTLSSKSANNVATSLLLAIIGA